MRVLLSSITSPLGPRHGDGSAVGYELLHAQVTRAQGIFSPRAVHNQYGLDFIAANLDTPTVTLHYPSEAEFAQELRTGGYSHVGIAFNLATSHKMRQMSRIVRENAPDAVLVLGGYGTVLPDAELLPWGDVICRGEGVSFMRNLLGEPPQTPPFNHPLSISTMKVFGVPMTKTGIVFGGLGCPNGCDFCSTSHYFRRRHIPLLPTGDALFDVVQAYRKEVPDIGFTVLDEDFLLNRRRALAFRDRVQEAGLNLDMFVFASVKALSQYTMEELVEIGVGGVWIGYEGTRSGYAKREGRPVAELVADLRRHGILVLASMIVGLDYQTPEIIREELNGLLALQPTLSQFLIYGPTPGTPLGERVEREGTLRRIFKENREDRWRHSDGFTSFVEHPNMAHHEVEELQRWCFEEDYRRMGPSIVRSVEVWLEALEHLANSSHPALRRRAEYVRKRLALAPALLPVARALAPSDEVRQRLERFERRLRPYLSMKERLMGGILGAAAFPAAATAALREHLDIGEHPRMQRYDWSTNAHPRVVSFPREAEAMAAK